MQIYTKHVLTKKHVQIVHIDAKQLEVKKCCNIHKCAKDM